MTVYIENPKEYTKTTIINKGCMIKGKYTKINSISIY